MKKLLALPLLIFTMLIAYAQAIHVFEKKKANPTIIVSQLIDSITTEISDTTPLQIFHTNDSIFKFSITNIDSLAFNLPFVKPEYNKYEFPKEKSSTTLNIYHSSDQPINVEFPSIDCFWWMHGFDEKYLSPYKLGFNENNTDLIREATTYIKSDFGIDTVNITQYNYSVWEESSIFNSSRTDYHTWQKRTHQFKANKPFLFSNISGIRDWIKYSISDDKTLLTLEIDENKTEETRQAEIVVKLHKGIRLPEVRIKQHKCGVATPDEQKEALKDLYNNMGGNNWHNNDNWLSDKPLTSWGGLRVGLTDDISELVIEGSTGEFPTSLKTIMDVADYIKIVGSWDFWSQSHGLQGIKIPKEITQHPRWNEFGWDVLYNNRPMGYGIDLDGINLKIKDGLVMFLDYSISTAYEVLSQNKYTLIAPYLPTDEMANVFLSYRNKGFGYIYTAGIDMNEETMKAARDYPLNITHTIGSFVREGQGVEFPTNGSTYILDSIGNVIDFEAHNYFTEDDLGISPNSYYANRIDSILHNLLGDPEPHDPFVTTYYTSTDYSRDGEVVTLQQATIGKGINLVFMGDAYDDRDMKEGGLYESDMRKSMEYFFSVEPYKSLRNRFNVYAVKVVSPNSHIGDGCTQAINYSNENCFNYASKIEKIDLDQVTIVNVVNNSSSFYLSGYTDMYESGASVAHIQLGGPSGIIVHEAGGHGFAKLLDEYIYGGYEDNSCPTENLESFKQWIKTDYHNKGWGVNVDVTNSPDSVVWSHFLQDTRYENEVGIYQGAWMWPTDLWRASENSVMNKDYSYFNAPSREAIYKRIMQLSEGDDWIYDYETFVEWDLAHKSSDNNESDTAPDTPNEGIEVNEWTIYFEDLYWDGTRIDAFLYDNNDCWKLSCVGSKNADGLWKYTFSAEENNAYQTVQFYNQLGSYPGSILKESPKFTLINKGIYNLSGYVRDYDASNEQALIKPKSKQIKMQKTLKHRMPTIIKGSPLNPQGAVPLPEFLIK